MIGFEDALQQTLELAAPLESETIPLTDSLGRVLASPVSATRDQPPFRSSAMDGYAVRACEVAPGSSFRVVGTSAAGARFAGEVGPGETVRVFTGAPIPPGADRVVIQEDVERVGDTITLKDGLSGGSFVRQSGSDFVAGSIVDAPRRLCASSIALLASMNARDVAVARRPRVAIMATGDELVALGEDAGEDQIVSSNNYGIKAIVESEGGEPILLPIAADSVSSIRFNLELAQDADVIVTLGGASVGDHDLVKRVATETGPDACLSQGCIATGQATDGGNDGSDPLRWHPRQSGVIDRLWARVSQTGHSGNARTGSTTAADRNRDARKRCRGKRPAETLDVRESCPRQRSSPSDHLPV